MTGPRREPVLLLVDDEENIRFALRLSFESEGFRVHTAESGNAAIRLLERISVDVVLSDLRMSDGDGLELLRAIRGQSRSRPVVFLFSGFPDLTRERAIELGAQDLFPKPFDWDHLLEAIRGSLPAS